MTANLLEAVRLEAPDAVVVVVGSGEEYGPPDAVPTTEDAPLRPQNPYAVSKASSGLVAGFYADAHGLRVIHARAFNHAGPGQEPIYAIANFAPPVRRGPRRRATTRSAIVSGSPDTRRDFTDVRDIVRAYRLLAARGEAGRLQRLLGRLALRPRADRGARRRSPASPIDHEVDPAKVRAHEVHGDPRLRRPPARRHRLDAPRSRSSRPSRTRSRGGAPYLRGRLRGTVPV